MSEQWGGGTPQYGQRPEQPYGQRPEQPYGQQPQQPQGEPTYPPAPSYQQYGPPPSPYGYPQPVSRSNGMAIAGFVCGLVGLLVFNIILGPLAVIFSGIGLSRANSGASHKGLAIAGIVLGVADVALFIILLAVVSNRGFVY